MRTASGFTNAVTRAEALGASVPQVAATGPSSLAGDQYFTCDPDGTPPAPTTPTSAAWHNAVTEEIEAVLQLVGDTCDAADNTQLAQALTIAAGAKSHASSASGETTNKRVGIANAGDVVASGAQSVASGNNGGGGTIAATQVQSAVRSNITAGTATITASGTQSVVENSSAGGTGGGITASGADSSVRSCATTSGAELTVSGTESMAMGCRVDSGMYLRVTGNRSAAIGVHSSGNLVIAGDNIIALGMSGWAGPHQTLGVDDNEQIYGGHGGTRTWRIDAANGSFYANAGGLADAALTAPAKAVDDSGAAGAAGYNSNGADYAERFPLLITGDPIPPRRLVTHRGGKVRLACDDERILGVVSVAPAILGDNPEDGSHSDPREWCPVALVGKVPVEVVGEVAPGDYLMPVADGRGVGVAEPARTGRPVEVLEVLHPFDAAVGYGVALCLVG